MMKRIAVWIIAVMFFAGTTPIFAADESKGGPDPNKEAYEHASEKARFKRTEDLKDKDAIKAAKKAEKEAERAKREAEKAKRKAEKEAKKKQKEMERKAKKTKKEFGK
ncbi:MAG: hypothetical protein WC515_05560 [Candidatus Omnitrophota bacterium]